MKFLGKLFLFILILMIVVPVIGLAYLGFIPGLSSVFGSNKPRNLGVEYSQDDHSSARNKSQMEYAVLTDKSSAPGGFQTSGSRPINTQFSSTEMTALMNNRPWKYYPYKNVQIKFNADGSAEISGILDKSKIAGYGESFDAPKAAIDFIYKFLPNNPVFYVKGKASLIDNKVAIFEPQKFEIGRLPMPLQTFLSFVPLQLINQALAIDLNGMTSELSKIQNKRQLIIDFINSRLSNITGFYAKNASFGDNKLNFEGTVPEKETTVR